MGSIQRVDRPKPWLARYRGPDGQQHARSFSRKVDAERWLKVSEVETLTGQWVDPAAGTRPFGHYAEDWISTKRSTVGETTATNTESLLRARVLPEFGGKRLKQITTASIRKWIAAMSEEGLSPSTVHAYRRVLDQILEQAVDDGLIIANPTKKAKAPPARPRRQLFLTADELRQLADECGGFAPLVWFLGWSDVRFGEAAALRVGRVNPERRRVRIEEAATEVAGRLVFGSPKTHEARTVIVPGFVVDDIRALLHGKAADDLVFTAARGGPLRLNNFRRRVFSRGRAHRTTGPRTSRSQRHRGLAGDLVRSVDQGGPTHARSCFSEDDTRHIWVTFRRGLGSPGGSARGTLRVRPALDLGR